MHSSTIASLALPAVALAASQQQQLYSSYSFDPLEHLAGIAPYFEPADPARDPSPPQGCKVTRAAYLVRHAAINVNDFDYETYLEPFTDKLKNTTTDWSKIPELNFLSEWKPPKYDEQELITRTGKLEASQLGVQMSYRYNNLRLPKKIWASSAERTEVSAKALARGLEMDDDDIKVVSIYESEEGGADNLTPYKACPNYHGSTGSDQSSEYVKKYTKPILARLHAMAPHFNWTSEDVVGMQQWCGYDTVVRGSSPFCSTDLFSPDEWLSFEYAQDIMYHYNTGYGNDVSGPLGFPWLNATMDLLASPPKDDDQDLYISFTHRELPPVVLVAMGLFNNSALSGANNVNGTMPTDRVNSHRQWISSYILPFLTNIGIEQMNCSASYGYEDVSDPMSYRVLVNRSPQTLPGCYDGPSESCSSKSMGPWLQGRGDMFPSFGEACDVDYKNSTDSVTFYSKGTKGDNVG